MERTWGELAPPRWADSARAIYELLPFQRYRQLPFVDVPYDPRREEHWADAARIADFASWLPEGATTVLDVGPGDGWPSIPLAAATLSADGSVAIVASATPTLGVLALDSESIIFIQGRMRP